MGRCWFTVTAMISTHSHIAINMRLLHIPVIVFIISTSRPGPGRCHVPRVTRGDHLFSFLAPMMSTAAGARAVSVPCQSYEGTPMPDGWPACVGSHARQSIVVRGCALPPPGGVMDSSRRGGPDPSSSLVRDSTKAAAEVPLWTPSLWHCAPHSLSLCSSLAPFVHLPSPSAAH